MLLNRIWPKTVLSHAMIKSFMSVGVGGLPTNAVFMCYATILEGTFGPVKEGQRRRSLQELMDAGIEKAKTDLFRVWSSSVIFWMPANSMNFMYTPVHFRPLVLSLQSALWMAYLSLVQHEENEETTVPVAGDKYQIKIV